MAAQESGQGEPPSHEVMPSTRAPFCAQASAVLAGWMRLPTAKTPAVRVRPRVSTRGECVRGSRSILARTARSFSGYQFPVKTTVSHSRCPRRPSSCSIVTPVTRSRPWISKMRVRVSKGKRYRFRAATSKAEKDTCRSSSVTIAIVRHPASARVTTAE